MRTKQVNQMIRHPPTTFGAVIVNVNKHYVSADARPFTPNYLLGVDLFNSKRKVKNVKIQRDPNDNLLVKSRKV